MIKDLRFAAAVWDVLGRGIDKLARVVGKTMGPYGKNVLIGELGGRLTSTRDGVTVARAYTPEDPVEKIAVDMAKEAAIKTVEVAGDGTTTAIVLVRELFWNARRFLMTTEVNVPEFVRGMEAARDHVIERVKAMSIPCKDKATIKKVCSVASNHDEAIADMVAETMELVGKEGLIILEDSLDDRTHVEWHEGMEIEAGFTHDLWKTFGRDHFLAKECGILLYDGDLNEKVMDNFLPIIEHCSVNHQPLLILCQGVYGKFLELLATNNHKAFEACVVVHPGFGPRRTEMMEDVAVLTKGMLIEESAFGMQMLKENGEKVLGFAKEVIVTKNNCGLTCTGDTKAISERVELIQSQIGGLRDEYEREMFRERCAKLASGTAKIFVGAATELERTEKKMRIEDAIHAARSAVEEGVIPGGGWGLEQAAWHGRTEMAGAPDYLLGYNVVLHACLGPKRQIYDNAGRKWDWDTGHKWDGVDANTGEIVSFKDKGIVDSVKCVRSALKFAESVVRTIIQADVMINLNREEPPREDVALSRKREAAGVRVR